MQVGHTRLVGSYSSTDHTWFNGSRRLDGSYSVSRVIHGLMVQRGWTGSTVLDGSYRTEWVIHEWTGHRGLDRSYTVIIQVIQEPG